MSHMIRCTALTMLIAMMSGCSERPADSSTDDGAQTQTAPTPEPASTMPESEASGDIVKASVAAGGVPSTYAASFEEGQLKRISELRKSKTAAEYSGEYVFYGARLLEYSGAALQSEATIELRFDMQGALTSSTGTAGAVSEDEIRAIRNRAQLLRSHALARRSVRSHEG